LTNSRPMPRDPPMMSHTGLLSISDGMLTVVDSTDRCSRRHSSSYIDFIRPCDLHEQSLRIGCLLRVDPAVY
jgi:hypothetical protein